MPIGLPPHRPLFLEPRELARAESKSGAFAALLPIAGCAPPGPRSHSARSYFEHHPDQAPARQTTPYLTRPPGKPQGPVAIPLRVCNVALVISRSLWLPVRQRLVAQAGETAARS